MSQHDGAESVAPQNAIVLARDPFATRIPVPFRDAMCTRLLAQLNHLIDKTELFVLVSGASGSGKTVLRQMFVEQAPKHFVVLALDASAGLRSVDLLAEVAERFGNRRRKSDDIHDLFIAHYSRGKQPVLVIDSAEQLESRALHLVAKLAEHGLHLVLFVRSEREASVAEKLDLERIQVLRVAPFDARRTYCYLQHCLAVVGYQGPMPFDQADLKEIQHGSEGLPAGINKIARERMHAQSERPVRATAAPKRERGAGPRVVAAGVLLALLLGVIVVLALTGRLRDDKMDDRARMPGTAPSDVGLVHDSEVRTDTVGNGEAVHAPSDDQPLVSAQASVGHAEPESSRSIARTDEPDLADIPPEMDAEAPPLDDLNGDAVAGDVAAVHDASDVAPAEIPEAEEIAEPGSVVAGSDPLDDAEAIAPTRASTVTKPLAPDNEGILSRNPRHFTMQLVAGPSLDAVRRFADRYEVTDESAVYELDRDGQANFALIYRDYATRDEALAALEALPDALKARKPWLRRLSSIQKSISKE